jgi:adenosylhomocysteine nucleosidase
MEFAGVLSHASEVKSLGLAVDWSRSARLSGNDVVLVANGAGWKRAAAAVDVAIADWHPGALVSLGFCGALEERLEIADVVVGTEIVANTVPCGDCGSANACRGAISSIDHVAGSVAEKRRLRASGAIAVEMEAAGVADRAVALGLPFYVVKAVTDLAGEDMANDFNAALRSDGHFDTMKVLTGMLRHPTARIPELIRLKKRCDRAARVLGDFIADCRF